MTTAVLLEKVTIRRVFFSDVQRRFRVLPEVPSFTREVRKLVASPTDADGCRAHGKKYCAADSTVGQPRIYDLSSCRSSVVVCRGWRQTQRSVCEEFRRGRRASRRERKQEGNRHGHRTCRFRALLLCVECTGWATTSRFPFGVASIFRNPCRFQ